MGQASKNEDTTVKLSRKALRNLESKAKPFESKKECLERIIMQNCRSSNESSGESEGPEQTEPRQKKIDILFKLL